MLHNKKFGLSKIKEINMEWQFTLTVLYLKNQREVLLMSKKKPQKVDILFSVKSACVE